MIYSNILETVGNTPVVRLNRVGRETGVEIYAKCEFLNPGGSVKDRIAVRMLDEMERRGEIGPGTTLIEPTSARQLQPTRTHATAVQARTPGNCLLGSSR